MRLALPHGKRENQINGSNDLPEFLWSRTFISSDYSDITLSTSPTKDIRSDSSKCLTPATHKAYATKLSYPGYTDLVPIHRRSSNISYVTAICSRTSRDGEHVRSSLWLTTPLSQPHARQHVPLQHVGRVRVSPHMRSNSLSSWPTWQAYTEYNILGAEDRPWSAFDILDSYPRRVQLIPKSQAQTGKSCAALHLSCRISQVLNSVSGHSQGPCASHWPPGLLAFRTLHINSSIVADLGRERSGA